MFQLSHFSSWFEAVVKLVYQRETDLAVSIN